MWVARGPRCSACTVHGVTSWWDRTDPTDDPETARRVPEGLPGALWNAIAGAALLVGFPVVVLSSGRGAAHIAFALFGGALVLAVELMFLRKLVHRIAGRRALSASRALRAERDDAE